MQNMAECKNFKSMADPARVRLTASVGTSRLPVNAVVVNASALGTKTSTRKTLTLDELLLATITLNTRTNVVTDLLGATRTLKSVRKTSKNRTSGSGAIVVGSTIFLDKGMRVTPKSTPPASGLGRIETLPSGAKSIMPQRAAVAPVCSTVSGRTRPLSGAKFWRSTAIAALMRAAEIATGLYKKTISFRYHLAVLTWPSTFSPCAEGTI